MRDPFLWPGPTSAVLRKLTNCGSSSTARSRFGHGMATPSCLLGETEHYSAMPVRASAPIGVLDSKEEIMASGGKKHFGQGSQGKGAGAGAMTTLDKDKIEEN